MKLCLCTFFMVPQKLINILNILEHYIQSTFLANLGLWDIIGKNHFLIKMMSKFLNIYVLTNNVSLNSFCVFFLRCGFSSVVSSTIVTVTIVSSNWAPSMRQTPTNDYSHCMFQSAQLSLLILQICRVAWWLCNPSVNYCSCSPTQRLCIYNLFWNATMAVLFQILKRC